MLAVVCVIVSIVPLCMIFCCRSMARTVPTNFILLAIFTVGQSFFFCWVTA